MDPFAQLFGGGGQAPAPQPHAPPAAPGTTAQPPQRHEDFLSQIEAKLHAFGPIGKGIFEIIQLLIAWLKKELDNNEKRDQMAEWAAKMEERVEELEVKLKLLQKGSTTPPAPAPGTNPFGGNS